MRIRYARVFALGLLTIGQAQTPVSGDARLVANGKTRGVRVEPQILSLFPLGASRNAPSSLPVKVEVRGYGLEDAYAVWTDCRSITAEVKAVEEIKPEESQKSTKKDAALSRVTLQLSLTAEAAVGTHFIRLIAPRGISNASPFVVYEEPVIAVADLASSDLAPHARRLPALPLVVSGTISRGGQADYFAFQAEPGKELFLEVLAAEKFDPQISLYQPGGSWFDPRALRRLAFNDEPNTASKNLSPVLTYRFDRKGPFLASVSSFLGRGGPDCSYQLRIVPAALRGVPMTSPKLAHPLDWAWQERSFTRQLKPGRLLALRARTVEAVEEKEKPSRFSSSREDDAVAGQGPAKSDHQGVGSLLEPLLINEDKLKKDPPQLIPLPALLEGTIDRPGDTDRFRFNVNDGTRLAFEIETPVKQAPFFTPRLGVFDQTGHEILNNVYGFVQGSGEFIEKVVEPKVVYSFERAGEYVLEVRDLTSRNGDPDFHYRILVRPQIPHVGSIEMALSLTRSLDGSLKKGPAVEHLNLAPGDVKKITVLIEQEEGFDGQVVLSFEGLPPGVEAFPAAEAEPTTPGLLDEGKKERFLPAGERVTIVVAARSDATITRSPILAHFQARPVVNGKFGPVLPIETIPIMIVEPVGSGQL
jgi:hypothetical protein